MKVKNFQKNIRKRNILSFYVELYLIEPRWYWEFG